jgi:hypothetical protein
MSGDILSARPSQSIDAARASVRGAGSTARDELLDRACAHGWGERDGIHHGPPTTSV